MDGIKILMKVVICIILISIPIALIVGPIVMPIIIHNNKLSDFANNLYNYPLPEKTKVLSKDKDVGVLVANGNHCDYMAFMTLSTKLSENHILSYYQAALLPTAEENNNKENVKVTVELSDKRDELGNLVYRIEILDSGYSSGLDFRCN